MPELRRAREPVRGGLRHLLLALAAPIVALILCGFLAWQADNDSDVRRRNMMFVVIAVAAIQMATGYALFGRFIFGL